MFTEDTVLTPSERGTPTEWGCAFAIFNRDTVPNADHLGAFGEPEAVAVIAGTEAALEAWHTTWAMVDGPVNLAGDPTWVRNFVGFHENIEPRCGDDDDDAFEDEDDEEEDEEDEFFPEDEEFDDDDEDDYDEAEDDDEA